MMDIVTIIVSTHSHSRYRSSISAESSKSAPVGYVDDGDDACAYSLVWRTIPNSPHVQSLSSQCVPKALTSSMNPSMIIIGLFMDSLG